MGFYLCWLFIIMFCPIKYYLSYIMFIVLSILVPMVQLYHWYNFIFVPMVQLYVLVNILLYINDDVIYCVFGTILYNLYNTKNPHLYNHRSETQHGKLRSASGAILLVQVQREGGCSISTK